LQLDDELLEQQQAAYAVAGVDESEPAHAAKKRKNADGHDEDVSSLPIPLRNVILFGLHKERSPQTNG